MLHQIGSGVLGPVFRTFDPQRDRLIAVKAFRLEILPEQVARLADALRRLAAGAVPAHEGLVPALDAGLEGTTAYLASEYVAAETLDVAMRHLAPAPLDRALPILEQIAAAIDAAWAAGIGHGALHPRDVFVTVDSQAVKLTGFGIGAALDSAGLKLPVRRPYTAPERVNGEAWDQRADVYSLGALAHELLTRRRPAGSGEQDGALTTGTSPEQRVQIRRVLSAALAEHPQHRFATARAFTSALAAVARGEAPAVVIAPVESELIGDGGAGGGQPDRGPAEADADIAADDFADEVADEFGDGGAGSSQPDAVPVQAGPSMLADEFTDGGPGFSQLDAGPADLRPAQVTPSVSRDEAALSIESGLSDDADVDADVISAWPPYPGVDPDAGHETITASEPPHKFPWTAVGAVAAAGLVVGIAFGYRFGRDTTPPAQTVTADAPASVDVPAAPEPPKGDEAGATEVAVAPEPETDPVARAAEPTPETPRRVARTAASPGRLVVRSSPSGALVLVDGRSHGQAPVTIADLPLGEHTVEVARSGYVPHREVVVLSSNGRSRTLSVRLREGLPMVGGGGARDGFGSMFVDSRPQSARVLVDGRHVGSTPLRLPDVRAGTHAIRIERTGYTSFSTTVGVTAGEQARVTAALEER